ncbi:unnamed protein product, partial [Ectocarpus sp. 6 AP-2014]
GNSSTNPGNVFEVTSFDFGRMGNHFFALYRAINLGFCCKSKMVTLPPKDDILAPGIFNKGTPGPRWFDFSDAPDVAGFNASTCPPAITWGRRDSFYLTGRERDRFFIMNVSSHRVECEAMYYFPTDVDICSSSHNHNSDDDVDRDGDGGTVEVSSRSEEEEEEVEDANGIGKYAPAKLVIHVRSGDIFVDPVHPAHGQFYLRLLRERKWNRVDIVTNGYTDATHGINPVIPALESRVAAGHLPANIHFHKYRSMAEDLTSLVCADALVPARSTVFKLLSYHATATQIFVPMRCSGFLTDLQDDRPHVKVR